MKQPQIFQTHRGEAWMGEYKLYTVLRYEILADGTWEVIVHCASSYSPTRYFELERFTFKIRRGTPVAIVRYRLNKKAGDWVPYWYPSYETQPNWSSWTPLAVMPCFLEVIELECNKPDFPSLP